MREAEQNVMCVLLQTLLDKELITQEIHDKSRNNVLASSDWPEFFHRCGEGREEDSNGHS